MEYTQRLECTQRLYSTRLEKTYPEQIGFLGICGKKYPVKRGPNKVGRDPQTCNIVLNLNSISRQHAVINILNSTDFMIMDLDSANKTKLLDKILQPYIPQPLKNGDTVQFGDVFGIFRLLEEDDDLPMTQAIDIPDTPVVNREISRANVPVTTIPESPDVSDRDDSFILASQPKKSAEFRSPLNHFIKSCGKTIALQPIGCNKIDNIYWKSSKKSYSFNTSDSLNDSGISQNTESVKNDRIHEMETQDLCKEVNDSRDSAYTAVKTEIISSIHDEPTQVDNCLHEAKTQLPSPNLESVDKFDSIFTANTQIPTSIHTETTQIQIDSSPSIYSMDTQIPAPEMKHLPKVCEINNQHDIKFHLLTANKENHNDIYNVETQMISVNNQNNESITHEQKTEVDTELSSKSSHHDTDSNLDKSGEVILFDEIDSQQMEPEFESQVLFISGSSPIKYNQTVMKSPIPSNKNENNNETKKSTENINVRRRISNDSNSSTDCEDIDILPTQKIPQKPLVKDGDNADILATQLISEKNICEDFDILPTQLIPDEKNEYRDDENNLLQCDKSKNESGDKSNICFEEMDTQIIEEDFITLADHKKANKSDTMNFEEMPTQVIQPVEEKHDFYEHSSQEICNMERDNETSSKQKFKEVVISPFKIPLQSPIKIRKRNIQNIITFRPPTPQVLRKLSSTDVEVNDDKYYNATQDIYNDLYSQKESTTVDKPISETTLDNGITTDTPKEPVNDDFLPCSIENYIVGSRFPGLENQNEEEIIEKYVSNLSQQQIKEIVGIEQVQNKKQPSDISDLENTPQKVQQIKALDIDLPSSQEIKSSIQLNTRSLTKDSSSDSEVENNSEEQYTPILFKENKRQKKDIKTDLTEKFDTEALPTRIITRVRKPTTKVQNCDQTRKILKPRFLTEQEENFNDEIIKENICRLRSKSDKNKKVEDKSSNEIHVTNKSHRSKSKQDNTMKSGASKNKELEVEVMTKKTISKSEQTTHSNSKDVKKTTSKKIEEYLIKEKVNVNTRQTYVEWPKNDVKSNNILGTGDNLESTTKNSTTFRGTKNSRLRKNNDDKQSKLSEDSKQSNSSKRSSREKRSVKDNSKSKFSEKLENKRSSKSPEILPRPKRSCRTKGPDEHLIEVDTAVRRSTRQKLRRENNEIQITNVEKRRSTRKAAKHEQSTVYNISSDSGGDSPKVLKRSATSDITGVRNPKRRKSPECVNSNSVTPAGNHRVLFTAFSDDEVKTKLEELGAVIVTDIMACTVLVTLKIKRTFKLLCAVGLGLPIVGYDWLQACSEKNVIVDPWPYLVQDETAEKRFMFNLRQTLTGQRNFLKGYCISSTPSALPSAPEMKMIVECSGGVWKEGGPNWVCVSCNSDRALWSALRRRGAEVVTTEFILTGVLRQRVDIAQNRFQ